MNNTIILVTKIINKTIPRLKENETIQKYVYKCIQNFFIKMARAIASTEMHFTMQRKYAENNSVKN